MDSLVPEDDYTQELDSAVAEVRRDEKWRVEYMRLIERDRENRRLGEYRTKVSQVRKSRHRFGMDEMADIYILTPKAVGLIVNAIDTHPDWDDEQIAESICFE